MPDTVVRIRVNQSTRDEILKIAARERRLKPDVLRLLLSAGLRQYRKRNSLMCGYEGCTRKDCCGGEKGKLAFFPHIVAPEEREERIVVVPELPMYDPGPAVRGLEHVRRVLSRVGAEGAATFAAVHADNIKIAAGIISKSGCDCSKKIESARRAYPLLELSPPESHTG